MVSLLAIISDYSLNPLQVKVPELFFQLKITNGGETFILSGSFWIHICKCSEE